MFSRENISFKLHRNIDHNLWVYVYLLVHLLNTPEDMMNGVESMIFSKFKNQDISWMPINTAKALSDRSQSEEKTVEIHIARLEENVGKLQTLLEKSEAKKPNK